MKGYKIVDNLVIEPHIKFLRISPQDLKLTLRNILDSFMDLSWIKDFDKQYLRESYRQRAEQSIDYIRTKIFEKVDDQVTSSAGEYVVSELARLSIIDEFSYLDIPLAELFKKQKVGNPGFDFYSANNSKNALFGEAKYVAGSSAYGKALKQISTFYDSNQHITDLADIDKFFCDETLDNCAKNDIGFIVAFSCKIAETSKLLEGIKNNNDFKNLCNFKEIILIAVDL